MQVHLRRTLVLAAFLVGTAGITAAQEPAQPAEPVAPEVAATKPAAVTPAEKVAQGEKIVQRAGRLSERITKLLGDAKKQSDVLKANCLNDKLSQVNASLRTANQRLDALKTAGESNPERANHEFTVLTVLAAKFDALDAEASACMGEDQFSTSPSQVVTETDSTTPNIDPASAGTGTGPGTGTAGGPQGVGVPGANNPVVTVPPPNSPTD